MKVEYTLTVKDVAAFVRHHARHPPRGVGRVGLPEWPALMLMGVALALLLLRQLVRPGPFFPSLVDWALALVLLCYLLSYFFGKLLRPYLRLKALRRSPRFHEKRTLAISGEALTSSNAATDSTIRWYAILHIAAAAEHAYFYIAPTHAIILPRRAFADGRQFQEFVDTARRYHEEARRFVRTEVEA